MYARVSVYMPRQLRACIGQVDTMYALASATAKGTDPPKSIWCGLFA